MPASSDISRLQEYLSLYSYIGFDITVPLRRDPKREVGYRIIDTWDDMVEDIQRTPAVTDVAELSQRVRLYCWDRERRAHARTALLMEREARLSREAWGRSMDASDIACSKVRALRTTVLAQQTEIAALIGINKWYQSFALRNFDLEVMEFESAHSNTTAKLPILKLENGNSWVSVPQTAQENGMSVLVTAEEKTNKKNDVKARSLLLMALPNEHHIHMPPEWNTHVVVWMNKAEIETMSIDDFTSSTNDVNTAIPAYEVSTASPQVSIASFSDNVVYAFMVENPNGSNLLQQDLEQIHEDDLEAIDLKWRLSLLSMRAKRYYQWKSKKIFINANDTAGYDKSKVECFNCHKMGHFSRECRAQRNKGGQFRNQDNTRKQGNNKDTSSKAMLAIDGVGFDWSDMAEEQVQTNMALMAFSDSEIYNDKTCLKNYETLKKQHDDLIVRLNQTKFTVATYKRGLATVEEQLITYRKNEVLFSEEVAVLKRE
ncbi:ribonuclease H-like domain-containing protein, partial [Tanacetum coccineum]